MGRWKMKREYINNETARRVTYRKRVKCLLKKTRELSVLCGVDACAIFYGPYSPVPEVWPSGEAEILRIISEYKKRPEADQSQRRLDQVTFLQASMAKEKEKLEKLQRKNRELEMENLITDIMTGRLTREQIPPKDLGDLLWVLDDKLKTIQHRITILDPADHGANDGINHSAVPNQVAGFHMMQDSSVVPNQVAGFDMMQEPSVVRNQVAGFDMMQDLSAVVNQTLSKQMEQLGSSSKNQSE